MDQADRRLGRLAFQVNQTVKSRDAEAVHDLRVALRRFSQVLRVFKPCFRGKEARKIRRELKQIMDLAGEVRNCDIALTLMAKSQRRDTTGLPLKVKNLRREAERTLTGFLRHWIDRKSSLKWRGVVASAATTSAEALAKSTIARTAQRMLPRMAQQFFERGNEAAKTKASPRELHQFRIASKKFRYTLELFTSVYGPPLNSSLEKIRNAQRLLGDINDCETVHDMLSQYKAADTLTSWLKKRQRRKMEQFQRYWTETFSADGELRKWSALLSRPAGSVREPRKPPARAGLVSQAAGRPPVAVA
ncbi:MAG: inorganic triphosphatase [Bryobacterales bacterium]|nr:inorganic triphosphatase [Bryobacterales bacterium]